MTGLYRVVTTTDNGSKWDVYKSEKAAYAAFVDKCQRILNFGALVSDVPLVEMEYTVSPATTIVIWSWPPARKEVVR